MFSWVMGSPWRFFLAAALLAAILCLYPARVQEPAEGVQRITEGQDAAQGVALEAGITEPPAELEEMAGADLSARTQKGCYLHSTLHYAPCGHSVQRRENLPAKLVGLSRAALESEIGGVIPGAAVTGFSSAEVDISVGMDIPCPLHWVLRAGEDGMLCILQNTMGEALEIVRSTDIPLARVQEEEQQELIRGRIYDDVQALEGYLESMSS